MSNNVKLVGAEGVYLRYSDGSRVIDASNTGAPLGHSHPAMVEAMVEASRLPVANEGQPWFERDLAAGELSDLLNDAAGEEWVGQVFFGLSGSEVNDIALSLSQAITQRSPFVTRARAYHGLVGLSRDATVQPQWHCGLSYSDPPRVLVPFPAAKVRQIAAPNGAIWSKRIDDVGIPDTFEADLDVALEGASSVIVDYTQGGRYYDDPFYQDTIANMARKHGVLWIDDEVVTGLGRCGTMFQFVQGNTIPDILTMGKPLAGGATPAGAVILSKRVLSLMDGAKWQNYSTFRGHPTMVHAMRKHMKIVQEEGLVQRAKNLGEYCGRILTEIAEKHSCAVRVAGRGLHWTMEFEGMDWRDWRSTDKETHISDVVVAETYRNGTRISTSDEPSSLFIAPPLTISEEELEMVFDALDKGLSAGDRFLSGK